MQLHYRTQYSVVRRLQYVNVSFIHQFEKSLSQPRFNLENQNNGGEGGTAFDTERSFKSKNGVRVVLVNGIEYNFFLLYDSNSEFSVLVGI